MLAETEDFPIGSIGPAILSATPASEHADTLPTIIGLRLDVHHSTVNRIWPGPATSPAGRTQRASRWRMLAGVGSRVRSFGKPRTATFGPQGRTVPSEDLPHERAGVPSGQPHVSFEAHVVRTGSADGARADFETMIAQLVRCLRGQARTVAANPGDWGIDVVVGQLNDAVDVWQSKYFRPVVSSKHQQQIRDSFRAAVSAADRHGYELSSWTLCVPASMDGPTTKWWDGWRKRQRERTGVAIALWDETELKALLATDEAGAVRREFYGPHRAAPNPGYLAGLGYRLVPISPTPPYDRGRSQAPSYLLDARNEVVPFHHRTEEQQLAEWRDADHRTSAQLVWGEGGRGKSRLAHEFALASSAAGWDVYDAVEDGGRRGDDSASATLSSWAKPLLVILDYSERWLPAALEGIVGDISRPARPSTRLLFLARSAESFWETLVSEFDRLIDHFATPIHLNQFTLGSQERKEAFDAAVEAFQRAMAIAPHEIEIRRTESTALDRSPLALHMAALTAVCSDRDGEILPEGDDLSSYLLRHERRYWRSVSARTGHQLTAAVDAERFARVVFLATLFGPIAKAADARRILSAGHLADGNADAEQLLALHAHFYPPATGGSPAQAHEGAPPNAFLNPLVPDRFAEDFIADCLSRWGLPDFLGAFLSNRGGGEGVDSLSARKAVTALIAAADRHHDIRSIVDEIVVRSPHKYMHTNSKGVTYYLFETNFRLTHSDRDQTIYFFAKDFWPQKGRLMTDLPKTKVVKENPRNGFLTISTKK